MYIHISLHFVSDYLSKFLSINSDSKFKNNVQLTVTDQLNKLTKGERTQSTRSILSNILC